MPAQRATRLWITGILGIAAVVGLAAIAFKATRGRGTPKPAAVAFDATTPLPALGQGLRESDGRALAALFQKSDPATAKAPTDAEAAEWIDALNAVRTGFPKFGSYGRVSALVVTGRILQRFGVDPAPADWTRLLPIAHDLLTAGMADNDLDVRGTAVVEVGKLWSWTPGRTPTPAQEASLNDWKAGFYLPVVRLLGAREPKARVAAVSSLGLLPIDRGAAAAVPYVNDPASADVRKQVLVSFAGRRDLLGDDAILRHIDDKDPTVGKTAEIVLKTRGLTQEQISLGSMIFHAKPEIRASVIPLLKQRTDIDPVVWLLQLSRDDDESVRIAAVGALAQRLSPEVGQRLAEMAATDKSAAVRQAAGKYLPESQKTAALPPLPGSAALNPKAN